MNKKEKLFNTLNNHFNSHNEFPEFSQISEEDIEKIIALYEQEASKGGKNPWHYLYFDELIIMQKSVYEVIKDNPKYSEITDKIEKLYEKELNRRLQRTVYSYGEPTDETYRASYTEMPEYSLVLADMCSRHMKDAQKFVMDTGHLPLREIESTLSTYEEIRTDFAKAGRQMPEEQEQLAFQTKTMVTLANEERDAIIERERQQKEIELINLKQEINKIENERLEIEKRIRTISSETLGSYFSRQISERYPEEYQKFQQHRDQIRKYSSNATTISNLKEKFSKVSEDLQFYKDMLPVYESYYQRFEEVKKEKQQQRNTEKEQKRIYNLIYSAENERLRKGRSLYTAWDLGNKTIPPEYQGMTYEQVDALINQKQAEQKVKQEAKATRDRLIGKAIRKDLQVPEDYHLSQIQIQNLSEQFLGYSNEELQEFITGGQKQEAIPEIKQQPTQEVKQDSTMTYNEFEKNLIRYIETRNSDLGKVIEIISTTGYPDSTYEVRFNDGKIHQITITQKEENLIRNKERSTSQQTISAEQPVISFQKPSEETMTPPAPKDENDPNFIQAVQRQKNQMINQIISEMLNSGDFSNTGLDTNAKIRDIEYAKSKLQSKSLEELQILLSTYQEQDTQEETMHSGMRK